MRREQNRGRFQSKAERTLAHGLGEVRRIASALELTDSVRDQACQLFRSAQNKDLIRGSSNEAMAAAGVYRAYRCIDLSQLFNRIARRTRGRIPNSST
jgi:transcription initiation factor TFIIB